MRIKPLVTLYFWILKYDDVTCIHSIFENVLVDTDLKEKNIKDVMSVKMLIRTAVKVKQ